MLKKYVGYGALACLLVGSLAACNGTSSPEKQAEEIHNPATQTIPEEMKDLIGRWDLKVDKEGKEVPSWLEVKLSGFNALVGAFVADAGSNRPVSHIKLQDGKFSFELPPQWEGGEGVFTIEGQLADGGIKGTITSNKGNTFNFTGVRAPYLVRTADVAWGEPIELFNGTDLTGWTTFGGDNQWEVKDGILVNKKAGANLMTDQKFEDFKLTAEFRYPEGGNSGIYLRGRYEVQIEDSPKDRHPGALYYSAVYGFIAPNAIVANGVGEWNTMEITLKGRLVTIVSNGKTVVTEQEIPGITGGALDSNEGEPGPIYLQGDHSAIEFRKITITPAK